jgi:N-carbamoyl-L-amino-acid hydrolase
VPGYAELDLQFRDASEAQLEVFARCAERIAGEIDARGGVRIEVAAARAPIAPTALDEGLRRHLEEAAQKNAPDDWIRLPSGAFHDAGIVSAVLPAAMLFIPSIGGISHDFAEDSREEDIVLGCQVLADAVASCAVSANAPR